MIVEQKELVLLPFPFSDLQRQKVRPALIVSNQEFNKESNDCLMVPLTSVIKELPHSILIQQKDLALGKLIKQSRVKANQIFSIEKKKIIMKIGKLNDNAFHLIKKEILSCF